LDLHTKGEIIVATRILFCTSLLIIMLALPLSNVPAQTPPGRNAADNSETQLTKLLAQARQQNWPLFTLLSERNVTNESRFRFNLNSLAAQAPQPVFGIGTVGRLTKWTLFENGQSYIGNSTIFESHTGMVDIGTTTPASRLTVAGMIESTSGGYKFPDGTVQTTAFPGAGFALTAVVHDQTLKGNGTAAAPLGVAVPLVLSSTSTSTVVEATNSASGGIGLYGASIGDEGLLPGAGVYGYSLGRRRIWHKPQLYRQVKSCHSWRQHS
jgi:hypothetical protein